MLIDHQILSRNHLGEHIFIYTLKDGFFTVYIFLTGDILLFSFDFKMLLQVHLNVLHAIERDSIHSMF